MTWRKYFSARSIHYFVLGQAVIDDLVHSLGVSLWQVTSVVISYDVIGTCFACWAQQPQQVPGILNQYYQPLEGSCLELLYRWRAFCRRTRTLPDQIKELKAELPKPDSEGNRPSSPALEGEIAELEKVQSS